MSNDIEDDHSQLTTNAGGGVSVIGSQMASSNVDAEEDKLDTECQSGITSTRQEASDHLKCRAVGRDIDSRTETRIRSKLSHQRDRSENDSMTAKHSQLSSTNLDCRSTHLSTNSTVDTNRLTWTANEYKNAGNKLCSLYRYDEAIVYYTRAISKDTEVASFYSNRALCHLKLQQWTQTIHDCRRALEIDSNLIKAHFFLGQALAETGNFDDSLKHLQRAHELAKINKMNFGDDITYQIRLIRRRRWSKIEDENEQLEDNLYSYLMDLVDKDIKSKLNPINSESDKDDNEIKSPSTGPTQEPQPSTSSQLEPSQSNESPTFNPDQAELSKAERAETQYNCDKYKDKLECIFQNLKLQRKRREVPDYLCGKISFELMRDPVITPSGITYDRQDIDEHLKRVGHFDPITRQPLKASQLISNLAMKEVVDAYLKDNEWALYY